MPVEVRLPNILRPVVSGEASVRAEGTTVRDVFDDLVRRYPGLAPSLLTPEGEMHRHLNVFVNDDDVRYLGWPVTTACWTPLATRRSWT